jgi:hypothetical protein
MEEPNDISKPTNSQNESVAEANSMAYAAAEAAAAVAAAESQEHLATRTCRICNKSDGRTMIHFSPTVTDPTVAQIAPHVTTFSEDLALHVFCAKTASILPTVNMPQYEILSKAGIKNKHGIGNEVNTALARTRCAVTPGPGGKDKQFYLVQEFEANLAGVRVATGTHHMYQMVSHAPEIAIPAHPHHLYAQPPSTPNSTATNDGLSEHQHLYTNDSADAHSTDATTTYTAALPSPQQQQPQYYHHHQQQQSLKPSPVRASAGTTLRKASVGHYNTSDWTAYPPPEEEQMELTSDGKVKCPCGGTYLPRGTPKGASSWRSHVMTKRHQKWMEEHGLMGAV